MNANAKPHGVNPYRLFPLAALLCSLYLASALPCRAAPALSMAFDGDAVVVRELDPEGEVVFFSVSRAVGAFVPRTERRVELVQADQNGEAWVPLEQAVPAKFFAVAVELATGRFAVLTPAGSPVSEIAFPADSFGQGPGRRFDRLEDHSDYEELLLVRPGTEDGGAWTLTTGDGAVTDESPASDGQVMTSVSAMEPVGESGPPPDEYEKGDLLVRIAPRAELRMEYYLTRIVR